MTTSTHPASYRPMQIILHWVVVIGVVLQFGLNEQVVRVNEAQRAAQIPEAGDINLAWMHVGVGSLILLAVLARLFMRFKYGVPDHPEGTPPMQAKIATIVHRAFYVLLIVIALTGMATWNGIVNLGDVHFYLGIALFFLIIAHAGAAIFNHFVRKDGTLARMALSRRA